MGRRESRTIIVGITRSLKKCLSGTAGPFEWEETVVVLKQCSSGILQRGLMSGMEGTVVAQLPQMGRRESRRSSSDFTNRKKRNYTATGGSVGGMKHQIRSALSHRLQCITRKPLHTIKRILATH